MKNNQQQILSEISAMITSMKQQLNQIEERIVTLQNILVDMQVAYDSESATDMEPIDIMLSEDLQTLGAVSAFADVKESETAEPESEPESEPQPESEPKPEPETEPQPESEPVLEIESVQEEPVLEIESVQEEPVQEPEPEETPVQGTELLVQPEDIQPHQDTELPDTSDEDDLPEGLFGPEPEKVSAPVAEQKKKPRTLLQREEASHKAVMVDVMVSKEAWRTDVPGAPVKDVIGAIALMDRVLFINTLFKEQPMEFRNTLDRINQMASFDDAVNMLVAEHPDWDMGSDIVYRFMMAVRRKLR